MEYAGVLKINDAFATQNADPGKRVYTEKIIKKGNAEYRIWDPFRSKLCGAMHKGLKTFPFTPGCKVLYLGASTGTTISHLSDVIGRDGELYAVEISPQCMNLLLANVGNRQNVIPVHANARHPEAYSDVGKVDVIYQDVAQGDQDDILISNAKEFLKKGGVAMICIKSQSIDVTKDPKVVFESVIKKLSAHFEILEKIKLEPFDKDHLFVVLRFIG